LIFQTETSKINYNVISVTSS